MIKLAFPVKIKNVKRARIPANGQATVNLGTNTGLLWKIPGTAYSSVDLNIKAGYHGNKNNLVSIKILRGASAKSARQVKTIQAETEFNKTISLTPQPGMIFLQMHIVKAGGMLGGILEKFWPQAPGVSGKLAIQVKATTSNPQTAGQTKTDKSKGTGTNIMIGLALLLASTLSD